MKEVMRLNVTNYIKGGPSFELIGTGHKFSSVEDFSMFLVTRIQYWNFKLTIFDLGKELESDFILKFNKNVKDAKYNHSFTEKANLKLLYILKDFIDYSKGGNDYLYLTFDYGGDK